MITNILSKTVVCSIENLIITIIRVGKYQKALNKKRVQDIVNSFDIHRMRPIDVSYRDGQYWVFDGQHRLEAYIIMGYTTIPCQLHYGLTYEDEALLFAHQQDNVGAVNTIHKWNALCEARDTTAIRMEKIAMSYGYTIGQGGVMNRRIMAVKELQNNVKDIGFDGLDDTLYLTRTCWNGIRHSTSSEILSGIRIFLKFHKKDTQYSRSKLEDSLKLIDPSALIRKASTKDGSTVAVRVGKAIEEVYNKGKRGSNKLKLKVSN